jgi:secondary thiamine-phosphate synthase enzyme
MTWVQKEIRLAPRSRGFHLITGEVLAQIPELEGMRAGVLHLFIKHTSASLTLNENADPAVRTDMETGFNRIVPEGERYVHDSEGTDDMPAHLKASLLGSSVSIPVSHGELNVGTWQGIYLCEHRNRGGSRSLVATLSGE